MAIIDVSSPTMVLQNMFIFSLARFVLAVAVSNFDKKVLPGRQQEIGWHLP